MNRQVPHKKPLVIGAAEFVDIPAWGVRGLAAKVDTGARTSALHVENVRVLPRGRVRFDVRLHRRLPEKRVTVEAAVRRRGRVRSTNGDAEPRLFVAVGIHVGPVRKRVELGLVDRKNMIYRMLLGRSALSGTFLVDAGRRFVLTRGRAPLPHAEETAKPC
jgi:hypothetical protein